MLPIIVILPFIEAAMYVEKGACLMEGMEWIFVKNGEGKKIGEKGQLVNEERGREDIIGLGSSEAMGKEGESQGEVMNLYKN